MKISKFSFYTLDECGNMLLYNSYVGRNSLCKTSDSNIISAIIAKNLNNLSTHTLNMLYEKGIVIDGAEDENAKLYSQFLDVVAPRTLHLTINPTERCNFRCKYCYETLKNGEMPLEIQNKVINYVRDNIHKYSGLLVSWFGGEPLLAKESVEYLSEQFIRICKFNKRQYWANMTTNGYLLDLNTFQRMLELRVRSFQITIDGVESIHDKQRITASGEGTYQKIYQNLMQIKKMRRGNFNIIVRTNFTKEIFEHFSEYLDNVGVLCENDSRFSIACYKVGKWSDSISLDLESNLILDASDGMKQIYTKILDSGKKIQIRSDFLNPGSGLCYGGKKNNFVISADGTIHKCTIDFEDPNSIVGSFFNNQIQYNDKYFKRIANSERCASYYNCFFAPVCTGDPCPLKTKDERKCSFIKDNLDLVLKILDRAKPFDSIS